MTHLNLDTQPAAVREFVLALSASPDGVVLESAGAAVVCVVPPPRPTSGASAQDAVWTDKKNQRRCELIDRKYDRGLSSSEQAELAVLQDAMHRHVDQVAPLPLEAARSLHQELLQRAIRTQEANQP